VSRSLGIPHLADLRDPWSLVERVPEHIDSPVWFSLARRAERRVFADAAAIVLNTERSCLAYRARYPAIAARMLAIRNGSDDDSLPVGEPHQDFRIRFGGSIYLDRNPRLLFRAAAQVIGALNLAPGDLSIGFMGTVDWPGGEATLRACASEEGVGGFFNVTPPGPRSEALRFFADADLLVSLPQDSHMAIPAKLYEYVRFPVHLLVLAERESATADLLKNSRAHVVDPRDVDGMASVITKCMATSRSGIAAVPVDSGQFDRRKQGELLQETLRRLVVK
jgi:hypothetical protein